MLVERKVFHEVAKCLTLWVLHGWGHSWDILPQVLLSFLCTVTAEVLLWVFSLPARILCSLGVPAP